MKEPSTNGNGRQNNGRFAAGNKFSNGNPFAGSVAKLRAALLSSITEDDIKQVGVALLDAAKAGDLGAIRLLLSYCVGTPAPAQDPDRVELDGVLLDTKLNAAKINQEMNARW